MENKVTFILKNEEFLECTYMLRKTNDNKVKKKSYFIYVILFIPYVILIGSLFVVNSRLYTFIIVAVYLICMILLTINNSNHKKNTMRIFNELIVDKDDLNIGIENNIQNLIYEDQYKRMDINKNSIIEILKFNKYFVIILKKYEQIIIPLKIFDSDTKTDEFINGIIGDRKISLFKIPYNF